MPLDTVLTVDIANQEWPVLVTQLIQDTTVLEHPSVTQCSPVPPIEIDSDLKMPVRSATDNPISTDPNDVTNNHHILAPSVHRISAHTCPPVSQSIYYKI